MKMHLAVGWLCRRMSSKKRFGRWQFAAVAVTGLFCMQANLAHADSFGVMYEAVNDYSACNGPSLDNPIDNARGFQNELVRTNYFKSAQSWENGSVYTSDFYDPEVTHAADADGSNFDQLGNAFSYYAGHGVCDDRGDVNSQPCTQASQCTSPPPGTVMPSFCRIFNGDVQGNCMYHSYSRTLAVGNCTSGPPGRGGRIDYSNGEVRLGESADSGGWAGAGANGGINFAVIDSSCSILWARESETFAMFAGIHGVGFVSRLTGDTATVRDRGSSFAARYSANPWSSVAYSWAQSMASISHRNNFCVDGRGNVLGGGFGVNGCGANETVALERNVEEAIGKINEPWPLMTQDFRDGWGNGSWAEVYTCNWDCNNNPGKN